MPSILGRARTDLGLLVLIGLVVALATLVASTVAPLTERTSDRAMAAVVRDAGPSGAVVATTSDQGDDGRRIRDPRSSAFLRKQAVVAQRQLPNRLAAAVRPGVTSLRTPPLHLLDKGPGRYLRLAYVVGPGGAPTATYVSGGPPQPAVPASQADGEVPVETDPWPVQVALSQVTATALGLAPGDRVPAEDEQRRDVMIVVSGVFAADRPQDDAWAAVPELLRPVIGHSDGATSTSGAAVVSAASLPDLRLAVPTDDLTSRVVFTPRPSRVVWTQSEELARAVRSLTAAVGVPRGGPSWDSLLDRYIDEGRSQVSSAQGQASVIVVGLLVSALLVLALAAQLLVRRRAGTIALARERGASLGGIFTELLVESLVVVASGSVIGLLVGQVLVGDVAWRWSVPVSASAALAAPLVGVLVAARAADHRKIPADRSARRAAARTRQLRRLLFEGVVLALAVLSCVALRQRGVIGDVDLTASSAPTWWTVAGGLVLLRLLPPMVRLVVARARRATGAVRLVAAARMSRTAVRTLPVLVVVITVGQLVMGTALAATEQHGQAAGALQAVGADARLRTVPDRSIAALPTAVADAPGVRAAVAARVADGVRASSQSRAVAVRLVVVDSSAWQRLLASSALPDAPQLAKLRSSAGTPVRALLRSGGRDLREKMQLRWEETSIPLTVVGDAPAVDDSTEPIVVVDSAAFAATGAVAEPDTIWVVGPGAAAALRAERGPSGSVEVLADVLDDRRAAPLAAGLVHLALVSSLLLIVFAVLGVALAAATEAPARAESLGRLRSLGLGRAAVHRVLLGELVPPVLISAVAGLVLGVGAALVMFGPLSLELVTGQSSTPDLVVPWWTGFAVVVLVAAMLVIARVEAVHVARTPLATLLRGGNRR